MEFKFQVQAKIQKPVAEVFDAVYNPTRLSQYFATGGAKGKLDPGTKVYWSFADHPQFGEFPVTVKEMVPQKLIALEWEVIDGGYNTRTEMRFEPLGASETLVTIAEGTWKPTEEGLKSSYSNCGGWMNMLCCLKAWVEYGINLRKGMF
jgi:uncharacterized protein YndB with AHSA1/START domain